MIIEYLITAVLLVLVSDVVQFLFWFGRSIPGFIASFYESVSWGDSWK